MRLKAAILLAFASAGVVMVGGCAPKEGDTRPNPISLTSPIEQPASSAAEPLEFVLPGKGDDPGQIPMIITINNLPAGELIDYVDIDVLSNSEGRRHAIRITPKKPLSVLRLSTNVRAERADPILVGVNIRTRSGRSFAASRPIEVGRGVDFTDVASLSTVIKHTDDRLRSRPQGAVNLVLKAQMGAPPQQMVGFEIRSSNLPEKLGAPGDAVKRTEIEIDGAAVFDVDLFTTLSFEPVLILTWPDAQADSSTQCRMRYWNDLGQEFVESANRSGGGFRPL